MHLCLVTLAVDTGMRKTEMLQLHQSEVDLNKGVITMGNVSDLRTKTGRGREIPLTARAITALAKQIGTHSGTHSGTHRRVPWNGYVFENMATGKPITDIKTFWREMCKRAKLEGVHFHDLRHTFATRVLHMGVDETSLMAITGHISSDSCKRYAHASEESKERAIEIMQKIHKGPANS